MRLRLLAILSALLLIAVVPASAVSLNDVTAPDGEVLSEEEPEPPANEVCTGSQDLLTVDGFSGDIETPSIILNSGSTVTTFRVDLETPVTSPAARAAVDVTISWGVPTNDYDLDVNGESSAALQPLDPATENVTVSVANCGIVSIDVFEFLAPAAVDTISLEVKVRKI